MISLSSPEKEGVYQASKWSKVQVLLDTEEMQACLEGLSPLFCCLVSAPQLTKGIDFSIRPFLEKYREYVEHLKEGKIPDAQSVRPYFSSILTATLEAVYGIPVGEERVLIKPRHPVIQLQAHHFFYSLLDGKFHPMVLSQESITWGIQFSYPQLFQDPKSKKIVKVDNSPLFPNTALFLSLQRWIRNHTVPAPFVIQGKRVNATFRVGEKSVALDFSSPRAKRKRD